jgi:hypothetical protein
MRLADAQFELARELGFPMAEAERLRRAGGRGAAISQRDRVLRGTRRGVSRGAMASACPRRSATSRVGMASPAGLIFAVTSRRFATAASRRASDDPQEVLDEALIWAARSDRVEALPVLVELGARIDADPYRGTALIWAAATHHSRRAPRRPRLGLGRARRALRGRRAPAHRVRAHGTQQEEEARYRAGAVRPSRGWRGKAALLLEARLSILLE